MYEYTARDQRTLGEVDRAFWGMVALTLGLTAFALLIPFPFAGLTAVVALCAIGVAYLRWSDRLLATYLVDLHRARRSGSPGGPLESDGTTTAGDDGGAGLHASPSQLPRGRDEGSRGAGEELTASAGKGSNQV